MATTIDHKAVWDVVRRQHGVVSHAQLVAFGFTRGAVRHRVAKGSLTPIWRGVYRVGQLPLARNGLFVGAVLACGPGAALSHQRASAAWGLSAYRAHPIHDRVPPLPRASRAVIA